MVIKKIRFERINIMEYVLPSKVRKLIYILATVLTPVVGYLGTQEVISSFWVGLYTVIMTGVTALAAINTDTRK